MKTLKTLAAALLVTLSVSAFAVDGSKSEKLEMNYALNTYIDAVTRGKIAPLDEVLDKDVKFTTTRGAKIFNHSKTAMLNSLKESENVVYNCVTEFNIVESTPTMSLVKVIMKYDGFSKINYVSLANTSKGWKITNVSISIV